MYDKNDLRKIFLKRRNNLTINDIKNKSFLITEELVNSFYYTNSEMIFTYIEMGSEVITTDFIKKALEDKKIVAVPVSIPKTREMFFVKIKSLNNLQRGPYGTKIPIYEENDIIKSNKQTLIIVPGIVFDNFNYRVGYGGGYYDTYLEKNDYYKTVGICFDVQKINRLNIEKHDKKLDLVISF